MKKARLIMEAANLAAFDAEEGINRIVVIGDNFYCEVRFRNKSKSKICTELSNKLSSVHEEENEEENELEYFLAV